MCVVCWAAVVCYTMCARRCFAADVSVVYVVLYVVSCAVCDCDVPCCLCVVLLMHSSAVCAALRVGRDSLLMLLCDGIVVCLYVVFDADDVAVLRWLMRCMFDCTYIFVCDVVEWRCCLRAFA